MPCYRCGARQTDPARGPSPWKRGVRRGTQVLVCPDCQRVHDWVGDLDRCAACGSTMLVRMLGETTCRSCGAAQAAAAAPGAAAEPAPVDRHGDLSADVAAALARALGHGRPVG